MPLAYFNDCMAFVAVEIYVYSRHICIRVVPSSSNAMVHGEELRVQLSRQQLHVQCTGTVSIRCMHMEAER